MRERALLLTVWGALSCARACGEPTVPRVVAVAAPSCTPRNLRAVGVSAAPVIDGKLDDAVWPQAGTSGVLSDARAPRAVVAFSEARAVFDETGLVVALYAADEDEGASDAFTVQLGAADGGVLRVTLRPRGADGTLPDGVEAKVDADGTLDDASDDDEEWTAEVRVPWRALGYAAPPAQVGLQLTRVDRPKGAAERELSWSACGVLVTK